MENPEGLLAIGENVRVRIVLFEEDNALSVPLKSIVKEGPREKVYVYIEGRGLSRPVVVGHRVEVFAVVTSGLNTGDKVIVGVPEKFVDGQEVSPSIAAAQ